MSNEEELEDIIVKKGNTLELDERGRRESSARDIPLESYVYAYMKEIHSLYKFVICHSKSIIMHRTRLKRKFFLFCPKINWFSYSRGQYTYYIDNDRVSC